MAGTVITLIKWLGIDDATPVHAFVGKRARSLCSNAYRHNELWKPRQRPRCKVCARIFDSIGRPPA